MQLRAHLSMLGKVIGQAGGPKVVQGGQDGLGQGRLGAPCGARLGGRGRLQQEGPQGGPSLGVLTAVGEARGVILGAGSRD